MKKQIQKCFQVKRTIIYRNKTAKLCSSLYSFFLLFRFNKALIILLTFFSVSFPLEIRFRGEMPAGLKRSSLEYEYKRIGKQLQIQQRLDTIPVIITFYKKTEIPILGIRLPEWGGGGALGIDSIFIPIDIDYVFFNTDYHRILTHELVHLVISRKYGNIRIPRWFHEGIAMALAGEIDADAPAVLSKAVLSGKLLSLKAIENVNRFNREKARLAYCQSHFSVLFLLQQYGQDLLPELLSEIKIRSSFDTACINVFGLSMEETDSIIRQNIVAKYHFSILLSDTFLWIIILIVASVGFVITFFRKKNKMKQMEIEEAEPISAQNIEPNALHSDVQHIPPTAENQQCVEQRQHPDNPISDTIDGKPHG